MFQRLIIVNRGEQRCLATVSRPVGHSRELRIRSFVELRECAEEDG
jgi:hypothetical protein